MIFLLFGVLLYRNAFTISAFLKVEDYHKKEGASFVDYQKHSCWMTPCFSRCK